MNKLRQALMARSAPWSRDRDRWLMGLAIGVSALIVVVMTVVMVRADGQTEADPLAQDSRVEAQPDGEEPQFGQQDPIVADDQTEDPFGVGEDDDGPPPVTFTADASGGTEPFEVHDGLVLLRVVHNGTGPFEVQLVPEGGQGIPVLVGNGTYRAVRAAGIPDGNYHLQVDASGPWAVGIEQPVIGEGSEIPASVEGDGESVSDPLELESDGPLDLRVSTESGDSLFVRMLNAEGELLTEQELDVGENLVDDIGPGTVIFDVRGEGIWQLHVHEG